MSSWVSEADKSSDGSDAPEEFVDREQWVAWRYEQNKEKKAPINPETGEHASTKDPDTWATYQKASERAERDNLDGIGFVLTENDHYTLIDLDDCRDPRTGEIEDWVQEIIDKLDCYVEISPSGTGLHIYIRGEKPEGYSNTSGVEVYDSGIYSTITGDHVDGTPQTIESRQSELDEICEEYLAEKGASESDEEIEPPENPDSDLRELGEKALHGLQDESVETFKPVIDFSQGGTADFEEGGFDQERFTLKDGSVDRSAQEQVGISLLYCTVNRYLDEPEGRLRDITWATFTHYCREHPKMKWSGKKDRRWTNDTRQYRKEIFSPAIESANPDLFETMVEKKGGNDLRRANNEYSELTYDALWDAFDELLPHPVEVLNLIYSKSTPPTRYNGKYPETSDSEGSEGRIANLYPSKWEVIEKAREIDENREEGSYDEANREVSYEEALRRMQARFGTVCAARMGQTEWVVYPSHYPDPPDACYVLEESEEREPEQPEADAKSVSEPSEEEAVVTDGGL